MDTLHNNFSNNLYSNRDFRLKLEELSTGSAGCGIIIIGIDGFKRINNLYTYTIGDSVLEQFSAEIQGLFSDDTPLYKLDGDNFGLIFNEESADYYYDIFEKIKTVGKNNIVIDNIQIPIAVSAGVCFFPKDGTDSETLYKNARIALVNSKEKGGGRITVLSPSLLNKVQHSMKLLECIRSDVNNNFNGFYLVYQPLILAKTGDLYGCEALLRWKNNAFPTGISPFEFIPILENYGMIIDVGKWVLENAIKQLSEWLEVMPNFQLSVNVSSIQFEQSAFKAFVVETLSKYNVSPKLLTLELTESGQIINIDYVREVFNFLRSQGIKIAIDDFGTGYASLEIFRDLSADELKIDKSFLEKITYDVTDQKIISQVIKLCESMNMFVCVEGIETKEIESIAIQLDSRLLQGYYYDKPIESRDFFAKYLAKIDDKNLDNSLFELSEKEKSLSYSTFKPAKPMSMAEIINNAYAGIFQVGMDTEFTFLTCNEGYRRMLGYTAKEMEEKFKNRALGFVHPDDMEYVNDEIRRQLGCGDTVTIEFRIVRSDGTPIWILGTGNVVKGKYGSSSLIVVIINNNVIKRENLCTEREKNLYHKIISRVPTGIKYLHYDKDFTIDYLSDGFLAIVGYNRDEIQTIFDGKYINLIYEEDRKKVIEDVLEQVKLSNVVVLYYRVYCKDGSLIWLETVSQLYPADEDGIQKCCSSVVNISSTIKKEDKNRSFSIATRYQQAAQKWGDIIFELDFITKKVDFSENFESVFGRIAYDTFERELLMMHPEDRAMFEAVLQQVCEGHVPNPVEVRVLNGNNSYIWCSVMFNQPESIGDTMLSAIGKISNIEKEKQKQLKIIESFQKDTLTNLYNKSAIEKKADSIIKNNKDNLSFALFIIDIDGFKSINDKVGHLFGDELLRIISKRLLGMFKDTDLVARTGGDEFMAFITYTGDEKILKRKARKLSETLNNPIKFENQLFNISTTIGIAHSKDKIEAFYDLYHNADIALYRAKEIAKGGFIIL